MLFPGVAPAATATPGMELRHNPGERVTETTMNLPQPIHRAALQTGGFFLLSGRAIAGLVTPPYRLRDWISQMETLGVQSLGVAAITAVFTGMVLALQTAYSLPSLGIKYYLGTVVGKSLTRELGPVLMALIVGSRIGSGIAAELGTMKVTEQVDALRAMALDPVKILVVPRLAGVLAMLPCLTILGTALGILGGLGIAVLSLGVAPGFYLNGLAGGLTLGDIANGVGKSFVFAFLIAITACHAGLNTRGGADGVGRATTGTVVQGAILILVSDFFLTKLFHLVP